MPDYSIDYAYQKIVGSIRSLSVSDEPLATRLEKAYFELWVIKADDLPTTEMKQTYEEIEARVSTVPSTATTRSSLAAASLSDLLALAQLFVDLHDQIARVHFDRSQPATRFP